MNIYANLSQWRFARRTARQEFSRYRIAHFRWSVSYITLKANTRTMV